MRWEKVRNFMGKNDTTYRQAEGIGIRDIHTINRVCTVKQEAKF